jgi:hypothetical protein
MTWEEIVENIRMDIQTSDPEKLALMEMDLTELTLYVSKKRFEQRVEEKE